MSLIYHNIFTRNTINVISIMNLNKEDLGINIQNNYEINNINIEFSHYEMSTNMKKI